MSDEAATKRDLQLKRVYLEDWAVEIDKERRRHEEDRERLIEQLRGDLSKDERMASERRLTYIALRMLVLIEERASAVQERISIVARLREIQAAEMP